MCSMRPPPPSDLGGWGGGEQIAGDGGGSRAAERPSVVEREGMGVFAEKEGTTKKRRRGVGLGADGGLKEKIGSHEKMGKSGGVGVGLVEEEGPSPLTPLSPVPATRPAPCRRRRSPLWQLPGVRPGL